MKAPLKTMSKIALSMLLACSLAFSSVAAIGIEQAGAQETKESGQTDQGPSDNPSENPDPENPKPDMPQELEPTTISGLIAEKALSPSSNMTNSIKVSPALGREVMLQRRLASGKWKTVSKYTLKNSKSATVKLEYPSKEWKSQKFTTWRVHIPQSATAQAYTSEDITLYTKNRVSLSINSKSAIVMNAATGRVLYDKNMNVRRSQASITKVMTSLLAIENNKLSKKVRISRTAAKTPWTYVPMSTGNKITVKNLLYASLLPSSNGSATALAQTTSGSVARFAKLMNKRAKEIGMKNTHYVNAHGLTTKNHYSSAYDTALLMSNAIQNKTFKKIIGTRKFVFKNSTTKRRYTMLTTNRLLKQKVVGVVGGKTGTTNAAGCCFTCVYKNKGQTYITVVLGAKTTDKRFSDTKKLINYAKKFGW